MKVFEGSSMVVQWFIGGSSMVCQLLFVGSSVVPRWFAGGSSRVCQCSLVVRQWFIGGLSVVQPRFDVGWLAS